MPVSGLAKPNWFTSKPDTMLVRTLSTILLLLAAWSMQAQTRPYMTVSAGWPEAVTVGMRIPTGDCTIGLAAGGGEDWAAASVDLAWHFAGTKKADTLRPWFLRMPLIYNRYIKKENEDPKTALRTALRVGYAWFPSPRFGLSVEAGPGLHLYNEYEDDLDPNGQGLGFEPGGCLTIYVRL